MTPFEAYQMFLALKRHFGGGYDYVKYQGKLKLKWEAFNSLHDRYRYEKLSRHHDPFGLIVSNIMEKGHKIWVGDLDESVYNSWRRGADSVLYDLENYVRSVGEDLFPLIRSGNILNHVVTGKVSVHVMAVLDDALDIFGVMERRRKLNMPHWHELADNVRRYKPLMKYDRLKAAAVIKKSLSAVYEPAAA
jgi:hypothetical protein